jgi:hypothetical protein
MQVSAPDGLARGGWGDAVEGCARELLVDCGCAAAPDDDELEGEDCWGRFVDTLVAGEGSV